MFQNLRKQRKRTEKIGRNCKRKKNQSQKS